MDERKLERQVRRAYEYGRLAWAFRQAMIVVPIGLSWLVGGASVPRGGVASFALITFIVVSGYFRSALGRGAAAGAWVGLAPTILSLAMRSPDSMLEADRYLFCVSGSVVLGAVAGVWLGIRAAHAGGHGFAAAAIASAILSVAAGRWALDIGSIFGFYAGALLLGVPIYMRESSISTH